MRTQKVYTDYSYLSDADLATLGGKTVADMTDNVDFPEPNPDLVVYAATVTDYRTKHQTATDTGGKLATTAKDIARGVLLQQMKRLSIYVNLTANGDAYLLVSSGFTLVPPPAPGAVPRVPLWVRVQRGHQLGQLRLDAAKVSRAWKYEYQVTNQRDAQGNLVWDGPILYSTKSRGIMITGLEHVVTYWVRVRAMNGYGFGDWTEPVSGSTE